MQKAFRDIVEKLKEQSVETIPTCAVDGYSMTEEEKMIFTDEAVKIVNQVAEEYNSTSKNSSNSNDEVCEWKLDTTYEHMATAHEEYESVVDINSWKYCPYCGKKIKVVE